MSSFSHNSWNIDKCSYFTLYHCVYVMVTTANCLEDSLKNTRLRCDKPFLWTIIRCHAMETSCIIATEHKYELNSVLLTSRILNFWLKYYGNRIQNLLMISLMQIWLLEIFANLKNMCKPKIGCNVLFRLLKICLPQKRIKNKV